jgi:beta-glucosidase
MKKMPLFFFITLFIATCTSKVEYEFSFQNPELTFEDRADDLLARMTLEEKINQLNYELNAVDRLGIPAYNWWNECQD